MREPKRDTVTAEMENEVALGLQGMVALFATDRTSDPEGTIDILDPPSEPANLVPRSLSGAYL